MVVGAGRDMRARHGKRRVSADNAETAEPDTDNGDVISTALRHHVRERKVRGDMGSVSASSLPSTSAGDTSHHCDNQPLRHSISVNSIDLSQSLVSLFTSVSIEYIMRSI